MGPPDITIHDAGKNFMAKYIKNNCNLLHIQAKSILVESPNYLTIVERYHDPVRRAYRIIKAEAPDLDKEASLQSNVKAMNDSVGPDGLVPTLLVYGAPLSLLSPTRSLNIQCIDMQLPFVRLRRK